MKVSKQFESLKHRAAEEGPLFLRLTQSWAYEFLSYKAEDSRPLNMTHAMSLAFDLLAVPNDPERYIGVDFDQSTNNLVNGQHLLVGFILSGRKSLRIAVRFRDPYVLAMIEIAHKSNRYRK